MQRDALTLKQEKVYLTIKDIDMEERTINVERQLLYMIGNAYIEKTKIQVGRRVLPLSEQGQ